MAVWLQHLLWCHQHNQRTHVPHAGNEQNCNGALCALQNPKHKNALRSRVGTRLQKSLHINLKKVCQIFGNWKRTREQDKLTMINNESSVRCRSGISPFPSRTKAMNPLTSITTAHGTSRSNIACAAPVAVVRCGRKETNESVLTTRHAKISSMTPITISNFSGL